VWGACGKAFRLKTVRLLGKTEKDLANLLPGGGGSHAVGSLIPYGIVASVSGEPEDNGAESARN